MSDEERICEECGKRVATWHLTEFVDGQPVRHDLCEQCYAKKHGGGVVASQLALAQLLAALAPELKQMAERQCPACGITYLEFRQSMRLGCAKDYEVFGTALEHLLERIHGATEHCGKVPSHAGKGVVIHGRLRALQKQQEQAIAVQNYELAAELRDRIDKLQEQANEPDETDG